jgi:hypothetical protein
MEESASSLSMLFMTFFTGAMFLPDAVSLFQSLLNWRA